MEPLKLQGDQSLVARGLVRGKLQLQVADAREYEYFSHKLRIVDEFSLVERE